MDYKTSNKYQSVRVGDQVSPGYRADRSTLFDAFNFTGKSVLDCGCNLGELSRLARQRGASLVDGYEYDPYFVKIGQAVNAHNGISRVSFYERDLTDPTIYTDTFDVTLAFSVYPYVSPVLAEIAERTREVLIVETHDMIELRKRYIKPISKYFPAHSFVATTDYGFGKGKRAVFIFAKKDEYLAPRYGLLDSFIQMDGARFGYIDPMFVLPDSGREARRPGIEALVTKLQHDQPQDLKMFTAGKSYWIEMMKGFLEYSEERVVTKHNSYFKALRKVMHSVNFDHNLSREMGTDQSIIERIILRFDDVERLLDEPAGLQAMQPIRIINPADDAGLYMMRTGRFNEHIFCDDLDGYHRIFWATLLRIPRLPAIFVSD